MRKAKLGILPFMVLGFAAIPSLLARAQSFGGAFHAKKIVLERKLPPVGHINGSTFTVNVTAPGIPPDIAVTLKSTIESIIVSNDTRLRTAGPTEHPDAIVNCQITSYTQPPPKVTTQQGFSFGKKPAANQQMSQVTGMMAANFNAQDVKGGRSIAANTVTAKYDQEFVVQPPANPNAKPSLTSILGSHIPSMPQATQITGASPGSKPSDQPDQPPTPVELKNWLIQSAAMDIASLLVNTTEQVTANLAVGPGLDDANRLMDQKLWTRALEQLESMTPFPQPDADAYRIYEIGVVNEALGYKSEDFTSARKYLQEASIDYGKAIDAKPDEKNFLPPQTRIDTALAHYKTLGDQAASVQIASAAAAPKAPAADALTNADVIAMVGAKLDQANIIDTIKTSSAVNFDLTAKGQIELAKGGVNGTIIAAMKAKARGQ
jgi:hypothetical protein